MTTAKVADASDSAHEEPEIVQEESIPSDGKDQEGEKMMEELGRIQPNPPLA